MGSIVTTVASVDWDPDGELFAGLIEVAVSVGGLGAVGDDWAQALEAQTRQAAKPIEASAKVLAFILSVCMGKLYGFYQRKRFKRAEHTPGVSNGPDCRSIAGVLSRWKNVGRGGLKIKPA